MFSVKKIYMSEKGGDGLKKSNLYTGDLSK